MASHTDAEILLVVEDAFAETPRPDAFTNHPGCCECAEHDALLQQRDRETLSIADTGNMGWSPVTMMTPAAFAYFMPALARLALEPPPKDLDWYGYIILFDLRRDGPRNDRWQHFTPSQREAVVALLEHLVDARQAEIRQYDCEPELMEALSIWADAGGPA